MQEEKAQVSSDLIRWLKLLARPGWAKFGLALIMLFALSNALGLLIGGTLSKDKQTIAAAVSVLTVALPTGLIGVALVFGSGGARQLKVMTLRVLNRDVPQAIRANLKRDARRGFPAQTKPAQRLYFVQDFAFFVRGMPEAQLQHV